MSLVIAGERSGVGKTTVTLAILARMARCGHQIQSFKVGPDYIDPMFHSAVTGLPCRNLDPVLTSEDYVRRCYEKHATTEFSLVEGVMGLFDGAVGDRDWGSTAHIAKLLQLPVVLVIDCGKLSRSVAAIVYGYRNLDPDLNVAGVILNHVSGDRHRDLLKQALEPLGVHIFGILGRHEPIALPDRYLGLIPTGELYNFRDIQDSLAELGNRCLDWTKLIPLLETKPNGARSYGKVKALSGPNESSLNVLAAASGRNDYRQSLALERGEKIQIAVAKDAAFNFYYEDNLDALRELGAAIQFWSPMGEPAPEGIHGLILGGGFPELFAQQLAANSAARLRLRDLIGSGLPTYAECGGLMYLCNRLIDFEQRSHLMVGVIANHVQMTSKLSLGYRRLTLNHRRSLLGWTEEICGHEFHRSQLREENCAPLLTLRSFNQPHLPDFGEGFGQSTLHASYVHLHWGNKLYLAEQFMIACQRYASAHSKLRV